MAFKREAVIRSAEKYVAKGKIEAAIREYRKVLKHTPTDVNTLNRVGDLYARIESFDEAVRLFTQIAEQYTQDGFFVKAIAIYKKIIKLDPSSLHVYEKLAALYAEQGLVTEARTQYSVLAEYYQKHDNAASAITIYQRMAELEPDNPTFQLKLAELFESRRLIDRALASYARLADIFVVGGSIDEAAQVYLKALDLSAEDLHFVERAVRSLREAGNLSAAGRVLAKAAELNPAVAELGDDFGVDDGGGDPLAALEKEEKPPVEEAASGTWKETELEDVELEGVAAEAEPLADRPAPEPFRLELDGIEGLLDSDTYPRPEAAGDDEAEAAGDEEVEAAADGEAAAEAPAAAEETEAAVGATAAEAMEAMEGLDLELEPDADPDDEVFVFEIDLDEEEVPESLVRPPADMVDQEAVAAEAGAPSAARDVSDVVDLGDLDQVDAEVLAELAPAAVDEPEPESEAEAPLDIDWSLDPLEEAVAEAPEPAEEAAEAPAAAEAPPAAETPAAAEAPPAAAAEAPPAAAAEAPPPVAAEPPPPMAADAEGVEVDPAMTQIIDASSLAVAAAELRAAGSAAPAAPADEEPDSGSISRSMRVRLAAVRREGDLLAEARVFAKYGLREKAEERLRELWNLNPHNLEATQLKTRLLLEAGDDEAVIAEANNFAELAERVGEVGAWETLRAQLAEVGFEVREGRIAAPPGKRPSTETRIKSLLEVLDGEPIEPPSAAAEAAAPKPVPKTEDEVTGEIDSAIESFFGAQTAKSKAAAAQSGAPGAAQPPPSAKMSLAERLDLGDLADSRAIELHPPPGAPSVDEDVLDESGMSWLDETGGAAVDGAPSDERAPVFEEDAEFFDLAAEIERELEREDGDELAPAGSPTEPSLEEIVEGFKRGVAEHLSAEDYDTHFNLGIAYREMGLLDEAIGEFQLASKDERYLVDSSSMLGVSFLEKGLPDLAIKWYRKGLEAPGLEEGAMLGLLYDMAAALEQSGNHEAAHKTWVEIYGINSTYRDVAKRIEASSPAEGG